MLALCSGRPVSSKQTRAKAATPARMSSFDGNAKHSLRCDLVAPGSHDHSGPGLKTTPALAAGATSLVTSMRSGSLSHKKMPPFGFHIFSTVVPNSRSTASTIASSFSCRVWVNPPTCSPKFCEKYSATTIWSSAPAHDLRIGDRIAESQGRRQGLRERADVDHLLRVHRIEGWGTGAVPGQ